MIVRCCVGFALTLLFVGFAAAAEITFQVTEVDLGQDIATVAISGSEWLTFGIGINGTTLLVYGPPNEDPFPPATDDNGVFEAVGNSMEIVFNDVVTDLEVDWYSPAEAASTLFAFDANGVATQVVANAGGALSDTEVFPGPVKRLVIESDPATLCVANLRFVPLASVPAASTTGLAVTAIVLLLSLVGLVYHRWLRNYKIAAENS